jgi:hypothetical protein
MAPMPLALVAALAFRYLAKMSAVQPGLMPTINIKPIPFNDIVPMDPTHHVKAKHALRCPPPIFVDPIGKMPATAVELGVQTLAHAVLTKNARAANTASHCPYQAVQAAIVCPKITAYLSWRGP